jgi:hypothetical protein
MHSRRRWGKTIIWAAVGGLSVTALEGPTRAVDLGKELFAIVSASRAVSPAVETSRY